MDREEKQHVDKDAKEKRPFEEMEPLEAEDTDALEDAESADDDGATATADFDEVEAGVFDDEQADNASEFIEPVSGTDEQLPQDATEVDPIAPAADSQPSDDDAVQPDVDQASFEAPPSSVPVEAEATEASESADSITASSNDASESANARVDDSTSPFAPEVLSHLSSQAIVTPPSLDSFVVDAASFNRFKRGRNRESLKKLIKKLFKKFQAQSAKDFGSADESQSPLWRHPIVRRGDPPPKIERGPYIPGQDDPKPQFLVDAFQGAHDASPYSTPPDSESPRTFSPTDDIGSSLSRPIVLVELAEGHARLAIDEALADAAQRIAQAAETIAEEKIDHALWERDCHKRAVYRD